MLKTAWIKKGALVVPYGTMSAVELSLTDIMDKMIVDDWGQCKTGQFGSLRAHVEDVPDLVSFYVDAFNREFKKNVNEVERSITEPETPRYDSRLAGGEPTRSQPAQNEEVRPEPKRRFRPHLRPPAPPHAAARARSTPPHPRAQDHRC